MILLTQFRTKSKDLLANTKRGLIAMSNHRLSNYEITVRTSDIQSIYNYMTLYNILN